MSGLSVAPKGGGKRRPTTPVGLEKVPPRDRDHLLKDVKDSGGLPTDHESEWYCNVCKSRVTVSPDWTREYGHARAASEPGPCPIVHKNSSDNGDPDISRREQYDRVLGKKSAPFLRTVLHRLLDRNFGDTVYVRSRALWKELDVNLPNEDIGPGMRALAREEPAESGLVIEVRWGDEDNDGPNRPQWVISRERGGGSSER